MGQAQTNPFRTNQNVDLIPNKFTKLSDSDLEDNTRCCLYKFRRSPQKSRSDWKEYMISQLTQLDLDKWPMALSKFLQDYRDTLGDVQYKKKVIEASIIENQKCNLNISRANSVASNTSFNQNNFENGVVSSRILLRRSITKKDLNSTLKKILEESDILEEKFLPSFYKELIEPRSLEEIDMQVPHESHENFTSNSQGMTIDLNEGNNSNQTHMQQNNFEVYKNNTLVYNPVQSNQVPQSPISQIDVDEMQSCLVYYKKITAIIEEHIKQERNVFKKVMVLFELYFTSKYQKKVEEMRKNKGCTIQFSTISNNATLDLTKFIQILCHGVMMFYDLHNLPGGKLSTGYSIFNYDNISNFLTTIVFNENLYKLIFSLYELENRTMEKLYRKKSKALRKMKPQDFGVPDEYCLNEKSMEYLEAKGTLSQERQAPIVETNLMNTVIEGEGNSKRRSKSRSLSRKLSSRSRMNSVGSNQGKNYEKPYKKAISALKGLRQQKSPIHKSKIILKTVELITVAIDDFYSELGIKNKKSLTGEHTFTIFCYLIANCGIKSLLSHCRIVNEFSTSNAMNSIVGYYSSTLEVCVRHICNMQCNKDTETIEQVADNL